ncbi:8776_t:CDS:1, partial [Paraglomus occultum]
QADVHVIRQSQILISEKFLQAEDDSEKWPKLVIKLSPKHRKLFFKNSKKALRNVKRKIIVSCAAEMMDILVA